MDFSHINEQGRAKMVDVTDKEETFVANRKGCACSVYKFFIINYYVSISGRSKCRLYSSADYCIIEFYNSDVVNVIFEFVVIGNYLPKCSRNSTIGLKLPWTLHSDENWNATHRLTGKLWIPGGVAMAATVFLPESLSFWVMLAIAAVIVFVPTGYSYWFYRTYEER